MTRSFDEFFIELTKEINKYNKKEKNTLNKDKLLTSIAPEDTYDCEINLQYIDAKTTDIIYKESYMPCHYAMRCIEAQFDEDHYNWKKFCRKKLEIENKDHKWDKDKDDPLFYIITTWKVDHEEYEVYKDSEEKFLNFLYTKSFVRDAFLWAGHVKLKDNTYAITIMPSDIYFPVAYVGQIYSRLFWDAQYSGCKWIEWVTRIKPYVDEEDWEEFNTNYIKEAHKCDVRYSGHYPFDPEVGKYCMNPDKYIDKMKRHPRVQTTLGDQDSQRSYKWMEKK